MTIAIPNITSVLEKNKKENYIADAKKLITRAEYELRKGNINKPSSNEITKISLSYLGSADVKTSPDGTEYNKTNSYVLVVRVDGYLKYFVNLTATDSKGINKGVRLTSEESLDKDTRLKLIDKDYANPSDTDIKNITGVNGTILTY